MAELSELIGKVLTSVENDSDEQIIFKCSGGEEYRLLHYRDCCEFVRVEDICGELSDLVGYPITMAEESCLQNVNPSQIPPKEFQQHFTWTFYKFATVKGYVTIRFYGESNGYYSERVSFVEASELIW